MMHRVRAKLLIACLIVLGEGVFASENTQRSDASRETGSITAQLLLLPTLDASESWHEPDVQESGPVWPDSDLPWFISAVLAAPLGESPRYHAFNPRAPPVPAS